MKRNLIAVIALLTANAALAMPILPGDLDGDWKRLQGTPEATSYVPSGVQGEQRNHEFIIFREQGPNFEFIL